MPTPDIDPRDKYPGYTETEYHRCENCGEEFAGLRDDLCKECSQTDVPERDLLPSDVMATRADMLKIILFDGQPVNASDLFHISQILQRWLGSLGYEMHMTPISSIPQPENSGTSKGATQ